MSTKSLVVIAVLCANWMVPLHGQSKLAFNIGGGISTPLNPTGAYTGVSGNFNVGGYVYSQTVAYKGASSGGLNAGVGFTIRLSDSGWKFYTEARYHYAFSTRIPTTFIPVTMGIRFN